MLLTARGGEAEIVGREHKVEQEPSTHAGETKYEGLPREGGGYGRRRSEREEEKENGVGVS